jgi:hypothetical protein
MQVCFWGATAMSGGVCSKAWTSNAHVPYGAIALSTRFGCVKGGCSLNYTWAVALNTGRGVGWEGFPSVCRCIKYRCVLRGAISLSARWGLGCGEFLCAAALHTSMSNQAVA